MMNSFKHFPEENAQTVDKYGSELSTEEIPAATPTKSLSLNDGDAICIIDVAMFVIRAKMDNRTVKKTLTIPWHLNELAEAKRINFSRVLREALQAQLGV